MILHKVSVLFTFPMRSQENFQMQIEKLPGNIYSLRETSQKTLEVKILEDTMLTPVLSIKPKRLQ